MPFRESKLTRLFQNYFVGSGKGKSLRQGKITMFVNVSNNASVFDETIHVLKFSALTSKVHIEELYKIKTSKYFKNHIKEKNSHLKSSYMYTFYFIFYHTFALYSYMYMYMYTYILPF